MAGFIEMIGRRISKVRPRDESDEPSDFSAAARACYDAIDAESPDAFEAALKGAIKACVAEQKAKEPPAEPDEDDADEAEPAKGY